MSWIILNSSDYGADKPLTATKMQNLVADLNELHAVSANWKTMHGTCADGTSGYDVVLDDAVDWRDRLVKITGIIWGGNAAGLAAHQPGGANDAAIHSQVLTHGSINAGINAKCLINDWLYTANGGASHTTEPYLTFAQGLITAANIWVTTAGVLKLGIATSGGIGYRAAGWELVVIYSDDLAGH